MRFLAGLRLFLIAAALIGLLGGRSVVLPVAAAHAAMVMTSVDSGHDCCGKTSQTSADKAGLAGACLGPGCSMTAPALLPAAPVLTLSIERPATSPTTILGLEGLALAPPLEPPRA
jgi:hypothetical protein